MTVTWLRPAVRGIGIIAVWALVALVALPVLMAAGAWMIQYTFRWFGVVR